MNLLYSTTKETKILVDEYLDIFYRLHVGQIDTGPQATTFPTYLATTTAVLFKGCNKNACTGRLIVVLMKRKVYTKITIR